MIPVILSGGNGTRLWPLSRKQRPKQFIPLLGEQSPFQATVERSQQLGDVDSCLVICNEAHRFTVAEQLEISDSKDHQIILEPAGRNTAPAIAVATLLAQSQNPDTDPEILVMPSDHVIGDAEAFQEAVSHARVVCDVGAIVSFGVVPNKAHTGYGYIRRGEHLAVTENAYRIDSFVEKPDAETAIEFLNSCDYYWNSGMLLFRASMMIKELEKHAPQVLKAARDAISGSDQDIDFFRLSRESFVSCPSISIDYAVMEHTTRAAVIPLAANWNDIGTWDALWEIGNKDESGNVTHGDVALIDTADNLVFADHRLVCVAGLNDVVVIETRDSVMVLNRNEAEKVRHLVNKLHHSGRSEVDEHRQVHRPWGWYDSVDEGPRFKVKRIMVKPGEKLSLQKHHHRAEHWIVVKGTAEVHCNDQVTMLSENQSTFIPLGATHRLANPGQIPLEIIEVQSGSYLGEDDIVRFEDDYGRTPATNAEARPEQVFTVLSDDITDAVTASSVV